MKVTFEYNCGYSLLFTVDLPAIPRTGETVFLPNVLTADYFKSAKDFEKYNKQPETQNWVVIDVIWELQDLSQPGFTVYISPSGK